MSAALRGHPGRCLAAGVRPFQILAAEDHPTNQLVLRAILGQAGVVPVIVGDGLAALEAWSCARWDLILMDIQMPGLDGVDATREIRRREAGRDGPRTPILALTAKVMPDQVATYLAAGMDGVVAKPIDVAALLARIAGFRQGGADGGHGG